MKVAALLFFSVLLSVPAQAGFTFFTNRAAWQAAVTGAVTTEDFNSVPVGHLAAGVTQTGAIQFSHPGPRSLGNLPELESSALVNGTRAITSAVGMDGSGFGDLPAYNDFILPHFANAFGANWSSASSAGQLVLTVPEGTINLPDHLPGEGNGFFGFISDLEFDTLRITLLSNSIDNPGEIYSIDNVSFNRFTVVPEPASYVVLIGGLGCILARRRHSKQRVS